MKSLKLTLFLFFSIISTVFGQNSLIINDIEIGPGDTSKIKIKLNNTDKVSGFQFKIKLPSNLIVHEKEVKFIGRNTNHVLYPKALGGGEYLFLCFSGSNDNFSGTTGDLIEIPIQTPLTYIFGQTYPMTLTEVIVSSNTGVDIGSNHKNGILKVIEGKNPDLKVGAITLLQNNIIPNSKYKVQWEVQNIGKSIATGGWREQISLVSSNGKKYIIGNVNYDSSLAENVSVLRTAEVDLPSTIGFDGSVKIEVSLTTNPSLKEPANVKENNTFLSTESANLLKRLIFTIDKTEITENTKDRLRINLTRSGDISTDETFTISSDANSQFNLPASIKINKNESSNFLYVKPVDNNTHEGDRKITLSVKGNTYNDENVNFNLLEDDKVVLIIDYPQNYTSSIGSKIPFTINSNFAKDKDQVVAISTNKSKKIQVPAQIILKAGTKTASFEGIVLNTQLIEKAEIATIYAKSDEYVTGVKEIKLSSVNIPTFSLTINPNKISEGDGIKACYATLKRTTHIDKQAIVKISASKADQLILPSEIVFEKGESEKIFNIGTVDNSQVEGERLVSVLSQIKFESCACIDSNDLSTIVKQDITILDNDGLALTVAIYPSTVKAGSTNNKLTISRNTDDATLLQNPVTVSLSNNLPTVISLPTTVTIPANKKEVVLLFNTTINPNLTGDQSIRIQAEAPNYSSGFGWILVSDQNKPDAVVTKIVTNTNVEAGKKVVVKTYIQNQGNAVFSAGYKIDYYLSKSNSTKDIKPFTSSIITKAINVDETYENIEEVTLPILSGDLYLIAVINRDQSIGELTYDNNQNQLLIKVLPAYNVTLTVNKKIYKTDEIIVVTGQAKTASGNSVPNTEVALKIKNQDFARDYTLKTNANGVFTFEYIPLSNESGSYTVAAAFPGEELIPQENFELLGIEIINKPQYVKWEPLVGAPLGKEFTLKNKTKTKLTGVKIQLPADADFTLEQTPISIEAGATVTFSYKIIATTASKETKYYDTKITITSNEGATYNELVFYHSKNQVAKLVATPISINTTMVKGQKRLYEFTLQNIGAVDAENVEILLPELDWLRLNSQKIIERIKSNEEIKVVLEFEPTIKEQVNVPINGSFVAKQKTGTSISIPFKIVTVSESTGKLIVDATDEYTYNTASAPHLAGAKVSIKQPYTGVVVAEGVTDSFGLFIVPNIPEGWYTINVSSDKHNPYQNNILVDPGKDTHVTAFLAYQAVTYSWDVKEIEIKDEYDIKLTVKFETNVPKPVVVMEIDDPKLNLKVGESRLSYITVTNHGLIAANKISISAGELEGYSITPLITSLEILNAKSTIIIPVLIKNESSENRFARINSGGGGCSVPINFRGVYPCDTEKEIFAFSTYVKPNCSGPTSTGPGINVSIRPNYNPGGGCGSACDLAPYSGGGSVTSFPDLCDTCTKTIATLGITCIPAFKTLRCVIKLVTIKDIKSTVLAILECADIINPKKCWQKITYSIVKCIASEASSRPVANGAEPINKSQWDYMNEDFEKLIAADDAFNNKFSEYLKNDELKDDQQLFGLFLKEVATNLDDERPFTQSDIATIKKNLSETSITPLYIDSFTSRWNTSLIAWNKNILSPNTEYPNIVDKAKLNQYDAIREDLIVYSNKRGFVSPEEMNEVNLNLFDEYQKDVSKQEASTCASVTIEFPQKLTMTRQAFEGRLKINNSSAKEIKDINLDLLVKDENGENKTHLFQINKEAFLSGTGLVNPNSNGLGLVTFIPTKEAAPTVNTSYSFGGTLSYFDPEVNERVNITLNAVTLEVNPSPDLVLHYFVQRDILGDDALTPDVVEPTIPAELSLMIYNDGYGLAKNVNVESAQPKIVDNEKGLFVNFNIIGSNFNNQPTQLGLLNVDFGTIEPKQSAIGQWFFTSSLLGHFIKYEVKVNHKSSFGNANLSLIKASYVHELIKSVRSYGKNSDLIDDFLVNDVTDANDTPDMIYLSDGTSEEVVKSEAIQFLNQVGSGNLTAKVKINPSKSGWNYNSILNKEANKYELIKVIRDNDNVEVPLKNIWQTQVTISDGLNPIYENKLHVLDKISEVSTYTLYYRPIDGDIPAIVTFIDAPEKNNSKPIEIVKVKFNKEIDVNSFTNANIDLVSQGVKLPSNSILIGKIDATTYSINIKDLTKTSGYYELLVKTLGIKDILGNEGKEGKKIEWLQFINELGILKFESDQIKKQPINTVKIIFNKPIRTEEFTADKITINSLPANNLTIQKIDDYHYTISGISTLNKDNGNYTFAIDVTKITAVDGTKGLALQTYDWSVDTNLPKVVKYQTISQGAENNQTITEIEIELNRKIISKLEASSIAFTKNGQKLDIPVIIEKQDDLHYKIQGLGSFTADNGTYRMTIDQSTFKDENDNFGEGFSETSWTVRLATITAVTGVKVTPDRGISNTDNITSGNDIQLVYKTLQDDLNVEVYELLATSEVLINKQARKTKGEYSISLKDNVGSKKFKIVAMDANNNRSEAVILSAYIDFTDIVTKIQPVNQNSNDCTDFDYVNVTFSDDINNFTTDAIILKSSDIVISKKNVEVRKINDKNYVLENIEHPNNGLITLEIDETKIAKKLTGLSGTKIETLQLGNATKYIVKITGEENPNINQLYTYTASDNVNKYDWIILNGEIISSVNNTVTVKWNKLNEHSLLLRYQTPLNCTLTTTKDVVVNDNPLKVETFSIGKNTISPVPNNGQFTIQTNKILKDCTISIFDLLGKLVHQEDNINFDQKIKEVYTSDLKSGMYILIIHNQEEKLQFKFLVE